MSLPVTGACFGEIFLPLQSWKYLKPETVRSLCAPLVSAPFAMVTARNKYASEALFNSI